MLEQPPESLLQKGNRTTRGTAPALTEGTAGVELVGGTNRAATAKPNPGAYDKAEVGRKH